MHNLDCRSVVTFQVNKNLKSGTRSQRYCEAVQINGNSSVRDPLRETQDEYTIDCAVHDSDGLHNDTIQLQIKVLDVSDTKPVFKEAPYRVDLSELAPLDQVRKT